MKGKGREMIKFTPKYKIIKRMNFIPKKKNLHDAVKETAKKQEVTLP